MLYVTYKLRKVCRVPSLVSRRDTRSFFASGPDLSPLHVCLLQTILKLEVQLDDPSGRPAPPPPPEDKQTKKSK